MFNTRTSIKLISALILAGSLSACAGGGGGGGSSNGGGVGSAAPINGTSLTTLDRNLGLKAGVAKNVKAASSYDGKQKNGTILIEQNPARISAQIDGVTTPSLNNDAFTTDVMNNQMVRVYEAGTVMYLPKADSNMHVGMVHRAPGDFGVAGVFGNRTSQEDIGARAARGGKATYVGQAEYTQELNYVQAASYRGTMTADADFDTGGVSFGTQNMTKFSDTGGPASMRMNGQMIANENGGLTGTFATTPSSGTGVVGQASGGFYGPNAQNIGLVFNAQGGAGAAVLNESR